MTNTNKFLKKQISYRSVDYTFTLVGSFADSGDLPEISKIDTNFVRHTVDANKYYLRQ